ncbi:MAG: hypothetical protein AAFV43_07995 [Planctomycetota bacterium]
MSNRLELPDDLNSLIEKRDGDERRHAERRGEDTPQPAAEPTAEADERRGGDDRRDSPRRSDD